MADGPEQNSAARRGRKRRAGCVVLLGLIGLILLAIGVAWTQRLSIADNVIADVLADRGVPATYEVESISTREQVLRNIVIGDPARPDLTIERAVVSIEPRFGFPALGEVRLIRPRLYGRYTNGKLSFGSLDPLIFTGEGGPFEFPDLRLAIDDGRALMETEYGAVGIKLAGSGHLRGGFSGELAAIAPDLAFPGCKLDRATLYGQVGIDGERPQFRGPLRFAAARCEAAGLSLGKGGVALDLRADRTLKGFEGEADIDLAALAAGDLRAAGVKGSTRFAWRDGNVTARFDWAGSNISAPQVRVGTLDIDGSLRTRRKFETVEIEGSVRGSAVRPGPALDQGLTAQARANADNLLGPILEKVSRQLAREGRDSSLAFDWTLRRNEGRTSFIVPAGTLRGSSGGVLLSVSRFQLGFSESGIPRFSGNFTTGGEGLPRIAGRMEQDDRGDVALRIGMAPYEAGGSRLALRDLSIVEQAGGAYRFTGELQASGVLPGGYARDLVVPLSGDWAANGELSLWRGCNTLRFAELGMADLRLDKRSLMLCSPRGGAIVRYGDRGLLIAAGAPSLELTGTLAGTPVAIRSGPIGFGWPGNLTARQVQVRLGPADTATTFALEDVSAKLGDDIAGSFAGVDVRLYSVPLDVLGATGDWRYANGKFELIRGAFRLVDRQQAARFEPLIARDATLALLNNRIEANALLRNPETDRVVSEVDIVHDLSTARGYADLQVPGLDFDSRLQPTQLTSLALGIVANVKGTVTGRGRIDWNAQGVTSSGRFSSDSLDLAAVFGPVRGASGTIEFTDLLGLTTAPDQMIRVATIDPGTEVYDGVIHYQLTGGELLEIQSGTWPFFGGTLTMRPVALHFGAEEERRYIFEIEGLQVDKFIARMELDNISGTGTFDGTVPIVFDRMGNGSLENGLLISRPPGGNVSYVGELTYEDMSPIVNFAFDALRSLDYRQMRVEMNGDLTGEIITKLVFDGVSQGEGAQKNFLTRRISNLPLRFNVNIRASFYTLLNDLRTLYDPSTVDPRKLGLIDEQGKPIENGARKVIQQSSARPDGLGDETPIQPSESEREP